MRINFDSLAIGQTFWAGGEAYKKLASLVSASIVTGQLLLDARCYPGWEKAEPPIVECPQFDREAKS